ncbi:MAG: hypothetical protein ACRCWI_06285 [Brevinema sp.]
MTNLLTSKISIGSLRERVVLMVLTIIAVVVPPIYHLLGMKGTIFLPIYFCLALGSSILTWKNLLILALINPTLNMLLTGMPASPIFQTLLFEGVVFTILIVGGKKLNLSFILNFIISLWIARFSVLLLVPFISSLSVEFIIQSIINSGYGIILNTVIAFIAFNIFSKYSH